MIDPALESNQAMRPAEDGGTQAHAGEYETLEEDGGAEERERIDRTHLKDDTEVQRAEGRAGSTCDSAWPGR